MKQNEMMEFIWLLNAASNSAYETKELYLEFLKQQENFNKVAHGLEADTPQRDFLEKEIKLNLESLEDLQKRIQEAIDILQAVREGA